MADDNEELVAFSRPDAEALINSLPGQGRVVGASARNVPTAAIVAVFLTPSTGTFAANAARDCILQKWNGTTWVNLINDTTPVTQSVRNLSATASVGLNKRVAAVREYVTNEWIIIWEEC